MIFSTVSLALHLISCILAKIKIAKEYWLERFKVKTNKQKKETPGEKILIIMYFN